jgi:hypothetical protein
MRAHPTVASGRKGSPLSGAGEQQKPRRLSSVFHTAAGMTMVAGITILVLDRFTDLTASYPFVPLLAAAAALGGGAVVARRGLLLIRFHVVRRCLTSGKALYLMPGAFTHVLIHKKIPNHVVLVKRGRETLSRHIKNMGPRHTPAGEWEIYQALRPLGLVAETQHLGALPFREIKIVTPGNVRLEALKGEERFLQDKRYRDTVDIFLQERGIPLNEFLRSYPLAKENVLREYLELIHKIWRAGYIDLDVAFRNYMVRRDHRGNPLVRHGRYIVVAHDFGSIFKLPPGRDAIEQFLLSQGDVADVGRAVISNGAFLLRSLTRKRELAFGTALLPRTNLQQLQEILQPRDDDEVTLPERLKHYSSHQMLQRAYRTMADTIAEVRANRRASGPAASREGTAPSVRRQAH